MDYADFSFRTFCESIEWRTIVLLFGCWRCDPSPHRAESSRGEQERKWASDVFAASRFYRVRKKSRGT